MSSIKAEGRQLHNLFNPEQLRYCEVRRTGCPSARDTSVNPFSWKLSIQEVPKFSVKMGRLCRNCAPLGLFFFGTLHKKFLRYFWARTLLVTTQHSQQWNVVSLAGTCSTCIRITFFQILILRRLKCLNRYKNLFFKSLLLVYFHTKVCKNWSAG